MNEKEIIKKLKDFIKNNKLTFEKGRRNSDCVIISGYTLYITEDEKDLANESIKKVLKSKFKIDPELEKEYNNVFDYAYYNSYLNWWDEEKNRNKYKL